MSIGSFVDHMCEDMILLRTLDFFSIRINNHHVVELAKHIKGISMVCAFNWECMIKVMKHKVDLPWNDGPWFFFCRDI
jgi:hypothetical protein